MWQLFLLARGLVDLFPGYPIKVPCLTAIVVLSGTVTENQASPTIGYTSKWAMGTQQNDASRACGAKMVIYGTSSF